MFETISYKEEIEEIKNKIRDNYLEVALRLINTDEYKKAKKHVFKSVLEYAFIFILVIIMLFKQAANQNSDDMYFIAIMAIIAAVIIVPSIAVYYNYKFTQKMKKYCLKAILQNLTEAEYFEYKEVPDKPCIINLEDTRSLSITSAFSKNCPFDIMVGNYKNTEYNLQELVVHVTGKKGGEEFRGAALKTCVNTNTNGWLELASKKIADKLITFKAAFIVMFLVLSSFILMPNFALINHQNDAVITYCGILLLIVLGSFILAKMAVLIQNDRYKGLLIPTVQSDSPEINDKFVIRKSDESVDPNRLVTPELCEVLEKIMKLYNTKQVLVRFNNDNIILLIASYSNLFEIGDVLAPPTNKKVCEKFVSEIAGVLIFMDYITSTYNK